MSMDAAILNILTDVKKALETIDNMISGNEAQVDVVSMPTTTVNGTVTANLSAVDNAVLDNITLNTDYPVGSGDNSSVTLTSANTAYAVPATASTKRHILILYNGSDTDMYWGYENTNANGILLPSGGRVTLDLGASQQVYAYCASASKVITCTYKEVN